MSDRPTLFLSNWASRKTPGCHGPGRKLTIMARPRPQYGECGEGRVPDLTPNEQDLLDVQAGTITAEEYRARFLAKVEPLALSPIQLTAYTADGIGLVRDGDTLCCACSKADAAAGRCHRAWSARLLVEAGWRVVLDGVEVTS